MLEQLQACPRQRWLREVLLFLGFFTLNSLTSWELINARSLLFWELIYFCLLYGHAQFQRFFLLPKVLDGKQTRRYGFYSVTTLLLFSVMLMNFNDWMCAETLKQASFPGLIYLYTVACATVSLLLFNVPVLVHRFYQQRRQQEKFKMCMQEMELSVLRSQLNPHFLFNTLNNLYGVSLHEPARTPDMIMQLSQLLRYQLNNTRRAWVPLSDELEFLASYISLETERVGGRCQVQFSGPNDRETAGYTVAPMVLMPFVENAFKHGTAGIRSCKVQVDIKIENARLHLHVENTVPARAKATVSTGVGLENTRQRLEMLYPGTHQLTIDATAQRFMIDLIVPLQTYSVSCQQHPETAEAS